MHLALIHGGRIHAEATQADADLGIFDIRDVSGVAGAAIGWIAHPDGTVSAPPVEAPSPRDLLDYASSRQNALMAGVWSFNVAASGAPAHTVTTRLDDRGQFAMLKVQGWLQLNAANPSASLPYSNVDFSATSLTFAEADSLVEQTAAIDLRGYALLNEVAAAIQATPPLITTPAQVDARFAELAAAA